MWAPHHLEQQPRRRQTGELRHAKVRHAGDTPPEGFAWRKTPTATSTERAAGAEGQAGAPVGGESPATAHTIRCHAKQISPSTSRTAPLPVQNSPRSPPRTVCAGQNSPCTPALAAFPVQNSPCSPEMAQFGAFSTCRESFVPLSPPGSRAGRILYRTRGGDGARQHNNTPGTTGVKAPEGSEEPQDPAAVPGAAGPGRSTPRVTAITTPAKVAHNFRRSFFETAQKRCYSNEVISMFEQVARELRAKLMGERPVGRQAASRRRVCPVSGRSAARGATSSRDCSEQPSQNKRSEKPRPLQSGRGASSSVTPVGLPGQWPVSGPWGHTQRHAGGLARSAATQRPLSGRSAARPCHDLGYSPGAPHRPSRTRRGWTRGRSTGRRAPWPRSCRGP